VNRCTEFHDIDIDMISEGSLFNFTKRKVYELCRNTDIIIMDSPEANYDSLRICSED